MRVLITGAAGLIGRELAGVLAGQGHSVLALLHRSQALSRNDGAPLATAPWNGALPAPGRIATLGGDVREEGLGLGAAACASVAASLDLVVHCAALTGFNLAQEAYERVNVGGTANALGFAARGGPRPVPLLLVSTAYVCGERSGVVEEEPPCDGQAFTNGYEASKAAAERLAIAAGRRGLRVAIARPSIVVGASTDGAIGEFGNIYQLIRFVAEGRIRVLPASPGATLDLVPIDHVVGGLADIAGRMGAAAGGIFHLVSGAPVPVAALRGLAAAYPQFHPLRLAAPERFDPAQLGGAGQRLHQQVAQPYASYLRRDLRFRDPAFRALTGRACPPTGEGFLRRLVDHAIAAGFLRAREAQRTSG